ncbi:MAG: flagellar biosynthesis protein FliQ [Desulfobacterales bacterium]|nr:flagellar biosynthesis protein FliQ [Desulfobacterales bacterium]
MTPEFVVSLAKEGIIMVLLVSMPMLGLGLIVGLAVSIFQAVTSIQEMTLTFIPKILAVLLGLLYFSPWILEKLTTFTYNLFTNIPMYIK